MFPEQSFPSGIQAIDVRTSAFALGPQDNGKIIPCDGTFTVMLMSGGGFDNFTCVVWNAGSGTITLATSDTGVTLTSTAATIPSKKAATVWKRTGTAWYAAGGLG